MTKTKQIVKTDKEIALGPVFKKINTKCGKGTIDFIRGSQGIITKTYPIDNPIVDYKILGIGGLPGGRVVEIYGPPSGGKTTLLLMWIAEQQRQGKICAFIDLEGSFLASHAEGLGVDVSNLIYVPPVSAEECWDVVHALTISNEVDIIGVDSVASLSPEVEQQGDAADQTIGMVPRINSKELRKIVGLLNKTNTTLILLNQTRQDIKIKFGNPETTPGGNAVKFHASIRLRIAPVTILKNGDQIVGKKVRITCTKSKISPTEGQKAEFELLFGLGIDKYKAVLNDAVRLNIISKDSSWYSYQDERLGYGDKKAITSLKENTILYQNIEQQIVQYYQDLMTSNNTNITEEEIDDNKE